MPVKPGYLTTEWWATVATNIVAALVVFAPHLSDRLGSQWVQPFAIVAAAVANVVYTATRGKVKTAAAHPLAYAPVPPNAASPAPFAANQGDDASAPGTPISDEHHDKVFGAAKAAVKKAPARKR
jgi:hypothetical protein